MTMKKPPRSPDSTTLVVAILDPLQRFLTPEEASAPEGLTPSPQFRSHTPLAMEYAAVLLDREGKMLGVFPFNEEMLRSTRDRIVELEDVRDAFQRGLDQVDRALAFHKNRAVEWLGKLQHRVAAKVEDTADPDHLRVARHAGAFLRLQSKVSETSAHKRRATASRNALIDTLSQEREVQELRLKIQGGEKISVEDVAQLAARGRTRRGGRKARR